MTLPKLSSNVKGMKMRKSLILVVIATLMPVLQSCTTVKLISGDKWIVRMPAGVPYTPASDGFFVPKAKMLEMWDDLAKANQATK